MLFKISVLLLCGLSFIGICFMEIEFRGIREKMKRGERNDSDYAVARSIMREVEARMMEGEE